MCNKIRKMFYAFADNDSIVADEAIKHSKINLCKSKEV